jgi:hypothetical protein
MPAKTIYHRMKSLNARMMANYKRSIGSTRVVFSLTTLWRKSGLPRVTVLIHDRLNSAASPAASSGKG